MVSGYGLSLRDLEEMIAERSDHRVENHDLPDDIIRQISPQIWEHINLTGIYDWNGPAQFVDAFRPLRRANQKIAETA